MFSKETAYFGYIIVEFLAKNGRFYQAKTFFKISWKRSANIVFRL